MNKIKLNGKNISLKEFEKKKAELKKGMKLIEVVPNKEYKIRIQG